MGWGRQGRKPGYVFGRSIAGQGYYPDTLEQKKAAAEQAAQVRDPQPLKSSSLPSLWSIATVPLSAFGQDVVRIIPPDRTA